MFYNIVTVLIIVLGVLVAIAAVKLLFRPGWLLGWLRGMAGLVLIVITVMLALGAVDFLSYEAIVTEKSVATLEFEKQNEQEYEVTMVTADGEQRRFVLYGDQWQLDARIIKWPSLFERSGVKPAYRLERISGRYYSWEKELSAPRSVIPIHQSTYWVDLWQTSKHLSLSELGIDATYGSATYLPMADGALYEVSLSRTGLVARPFNQLAEDAINRWN